MKINTIPLFILSLSWFSCTTPATKEESVKSSSEISLKEKNTSDLVIGKWDSKILKVKKTTVGGSEQNEVIDVNPDNYEEVVGLKTAIVYFNQDSTYKEEYILPDGQIAFTQEGIWTINGDTLTTFITSPGSNEFRYHFRIEGDSAYFTARMDYDGDGEKDDDFYGVSVRDSNF